ncbi:hypothetical protein [Falsarthrobacter nasiphocae]|uniref:hypothetical protein n=1 Tax=Falsarthrobacter nasiphocae TaxID=189863 RepID=UPI0031D4D621
MSQGFSQPLRVLVPFAQLDEHEQINPNIQAANPVDRYFECMKVAFASVKRVSPDAELVFISNAPLPERHRTDFEALGVASEVIPFLHKAPQGFLPSFQASVFVLDVVAGLDERPCILLDPDVVVIRPLEELVEELGGQCGAYALKMPARHMYNGVSRLTSAEAHARIDGDRTLPWYYGGEMYVFQGPSVRAIQARAERAWETALAEFEAGRTDYLRTEEHIMNYALHRQDVASLDHRVRRIWTAHSMRGVRADDGDLTVWHLPAEKSGGFSRVAVAVGKRDSWFWTVSLPEWRSRLSEEFVLGRRTPLRLALDLAGHGRRLWRQRRVPPFEQLHDHT